MTKYTANLCFQSTLVTACSIISVEGISSLLQVRRSRPNSEKATAKAKATRSAVERPRRQAGPVKYNDNDDADEEELDESSSGEENDLEGSHEAQAETDSEKQAQSQDENDDSSDDNMPLATARRAPRAVSSFAVCPN